MSALVFPCTAQGYVISSASGDPVLLAKALAAAGYDREFCVSACFDPPYIAGLMAAGFLVMSRDKPPVLLPKLHLERAALFFPELHAGKTVRRLLPRCELKEADFAAILSRCAAAHGEDWLTPRLQKSLLSLSRRPGQGQNAKIRLLAFGLYCRGRLAAGEFGAAAGRVYTSYSGFYTEKSAGTVQLVLLGRYLETAGYAFWDLGMPMPYKTSLGARTLSRKEFLNRFYAAQEPPL
jgi:Leu/Phe-tRNA-protein transferase